MKVAKTHETKPSNLSTGASQTKLVLTSNPATPQPGATTSITVDVTRGGQAVAGYDDVHTKPMHLIAVSEDLRDFIHVHPEKRGASFTADVVFAESSRYRMWTEVQPKGDRSSTTTATDLSTAGAKPASPDLVAEGNATHTVDGLKASLGGATAIKAGKSLTLTVDVTDAATGKPAKLEPLLGAAAHAIVISADREQFMHLHGALAGVADDHGGARHDAGMAGMGGMSGMDHGAAATTARTAGAPTKLEIEATFPKPGLYKVFVQMQRDGDVVTVPFVVRVS